MINYLGGDQFPELGHQMVRLNALPGDIQGQVFRIYDALNETEKARQQILAVFLDQHFAGVKLQPILFTKGEDVALW